MFKNPVVLNGADSWRLMVRLFKYGVASGIALIVTLGTSFFAYHIIGIAYTAAQALGFIVGTSVNYPLNRKWTFANTYHRTVLQFIVFLGVVLIGFGWNEVALILAVSEWHWPVLLGMIFGVCAGFVWNFSLNNWVTFKRFA